MGEWGQWGMTAWNTGSRATGSMRPEAPLLSSSSSRYGTPTSPGRGSRETLGPGIDGREGASSSVQETSLGPRLPYQIGTKAQTRAPCHAHMFAYVHACTRVHAHIHTHSGSLPVSGGSHVPCLALRLASHRAGHVPALARLPCDWLSCVQNRGWDRKRGRARLEHFSQGALTA